MGNLMDLSNKNGMSLFKLTVQERILLHLSEFSKFVDQLEVPFTLTQEGIAQSVGVVRSAIPRAIKKLIAKEHVREELAHVTGLSRRRKIYYLTTDGLVFASNLKNKLFTKNITIIIDENQKIESKIQDVPKKVNKKIRILDIILNLSSDNVFNFREYEQVDSCSSTSVAKEVVEESQVAHDLKTTISPKKIEIPLGKKYYIDKAPKISYFVGRKKELRIIHDCMNEDKCKMVIIQGIAGIGKTTLAVKLLEELYKNYSLFWYRCHEWDTLRNILMQKYWNLILMV
jgi:nucleoside-triphosphatase THEP1